MMYPTQQYITISDWLLHCNSNIKIKIDYSDVWIITMDYYISVDTIDVCDFTTLKRKKEDNTAVESGL